MIRGKKVKFLVFVTLALVLVISLVAGACAEAAPEGAAEEEIAALESELAAEKAKTKAAEGEVSDLEAEIAALKAPGEVQEWEPSTWLSAGIIWDTLVYEAEIITSMSDGRIVVTATAPGAVCPVEEQLDAVATGATEVMSVWPGYFPGKVTITALQGGDVVIPVTMGELGELYGSFEGGRINELFREEYAKYGDVYFIDNEFWTCNNIITSTVPIYGVADLEGVPFRSSELVARVLASFGAGTVWFPGGEIYTSLATGIVDACTFSGAPDALAMSFHEVTSYWIKQPVALAGASDAWIINGTVWENLDDDLKAIVEGAIEAGSWRNQWVQEMDMAKAWITAEEYGIEVIVWSAEDQAAFYAKTQELAIAEWSDDPACAEYFEIAERFMIEKGYW